MQDSNSGTGNWVLAAILLGIIVYGVGQQRVQEAELKAKMAGNETLQKEIKGDPTLVKSPEKEVSEVAQVSQEKVETPQQDTAAETQEQAPKGGFLAQVDEIRNLGDNLKQEYSELQSMNNQLRAFQSMAQGEEAQKQFQTFLQEFMQRQRAFQSGRQIYGAKIDAALAEAKTQAEAKGASSEVRLAYAFLAGETGDQETKVRILQEEASRGVLDFRSSLDLAMTYDQTNEMQKGSEILRKLYSNPEISEEQKKNVGVMLAEQLFWIEDYDGAIALYDELAQYPDLVALIEKPRQSAVDYKAAKAEELVFRSKAQNLPMGEIHTNKGVVEIELFEDDAPNGVANFITLAESGFYDGIKFHRVIPKFMAQVGDPNSKDEDPSNDGSGGPGYRIKTELNNRKHFRGSLSYANAGIDTDGSQIFLCVVPTYWLNGRHAVFGRITKGQEIVDGITKGDVIEKVVITRKRDHDYTVTKL